MSWPRLLLRHLRLSGARWAVLALVVALVSALAMAWPRWLAVTTAQEVRLRLADASAAYVDPAAAPGDLALDIPSGTVTVDPATGRVTHQLPDASAWQGVDPWGSVFATLDGRRAELPEPVRDVLGDPQAWQVWPAVQTFDSTVTDRDATSAQPASAPGALDRARFVEGRPPADDEPAGSGGDDGPVRIELAMSVESAQQMRWQVGVVRATATTAVDGARPVEMQLVGTFEPDDPGSRYWQNSATLLHPTIAHSPNGITVSARGLVSQGAGLPTVLELASPAGAMVGGTTSRLWFPLQPDRIDAANAGLVAEQLRTALATVPLSATSATTEFATEAPDRIDEVLARAATARSVLALAVAAPAGVLLALLALAAQVVVAPRRSAQLLTGLRGGSLAQHRALLGTEAALACLPAAAVGGIVVLALVPAAVGPWWWLGPAVLGLVPVLALATASPTPRVASRAAPRVAVEVGVAVLAAAAVVELVRRGTTGGAGTDVLSVVAPLLLAVVVALGCARAVPWLLRPLAARLSRRDDLVAPLGAALAARRPQPVVASVAMVAGTAVALLGVLFTSTVDTAQESAALRYVGADVRVLGALDDAHLDALRAVPGVSQVATVAATPSVRLWAGANTRLVSTLYAVDPELTDVQRDVPGAVPVPAVGDLVVARTVPVDAGGPAELTTTPRLTLTVAAKLADAPGLTTAKTWLLVDRRTLEGTNVRYVVTAAYLSLADGADPVAVAAAVRDAVGPGLNVLAAHERLEQLRTAPTARALSTGILVVVVAGLLAAMLAVALALAARSANRTRLVAVLRTMGLPPGAEVRLVLWEATPSVVAAVVAGTGLGFALSRLLLTAIDVRPFTGGSTQPPLVIGAGLAVALGAVLLVAAAAVATSAWAAARRSAAVVLRAGEDRE